MFGSKKNKPEPRLTIDSLTIHVAHGERTVGQLKADLAQNNRVIHSPKRIEMGEGNLVELKNFDDAARAAYFVTAMVSDFATRTLIPEHKAIPIIGTLLAHVRREAISAHTDSSSLATLVTSQYAGTHDNWEEFAEALIKKSLKDVPGAPSYTDLIHDDALDMKAILAGHVAERYVNEGKYYYKKETYV